MFNEMKNPAHTQRYSWLVYPKSPKHNKPAERVNITTIINPIMTVVRAESFPRNDREHIIEAITRPTQPFVRQISE